MNNPQTQESETSIRFKVRQQWREEGILTVHRDYPIGTWQHGVALDEGHKIFFEQEQSL